MPKDKYGKYLTWRQYLRRWKEGIEGITPLQQAKITYKSTWIILIGIVLGIVFSLFALKQLWWLLIILIGALLNTIVIQIGNYQKLSILRRMEYVM